MKEFLIIFLIRFLILPMNNKNKYTLLRLSRILFSPFYTIISFFIKKNNNIIITASLNNEFSDNARALFEILVEREEYKSRVYFVINDKKKREELNLLYPGKFISNSTFKEAVFILRAGYWFSSAMELPLGAFFQAYVRQVIHLGHGMLYKKIGLIENDLKWYKKIYYFLVKSSFTYTIATTEFCKRYISAGFGMPADRVLITPQPKTAQIASPLGFKGSSQLQAESLHVLYAPTWRPYGRVELFPFKDMDICSLSNFLQSHNIHIWLRVHPRFEQDIDSQLLNCNNIHLFSVKEYSEVNYYLSCFDVLITDYSSIFYDYLTLKRPVFFFDYDLDEYRNKVGIIDEFEKVKCSQTTRSIEHFKQQLLDIKSNNIDLSKLESAHYLVNYPADNEMIPDILLDTLNLK